MSNLPLKCRSGVAATVPAAKGLTHVEGILRGPWPFVCNKNSKSHERDLGKQVGHASQESYSIYHIGSDRGLSVPTQQLHITSKCMSCMCLPPHVSLVRLFVPKKRSTNTHTRPELHSIKDRAVDSISNWYKGSAYKKRILANGQLYSGREGGFLLLSPTLSFINSLSRYDTRARHTSIHRAVEKVQSLLRPSS